MIALISYCHILPTSQNTYHQYPGPSVANGHNLHIRINGYTAARVP